MLLATIDRTKYAAQIDKLIDQLYSYETPEGGMAVSVRQEGQAGGLHLLQRRLRPGRGRTPPGDR